MSWKPRRWAPRYAVLGSVAVEVVMLDLALPDSTGIGTLTRMLARTQSLPIVVLTATAQRYEEHVAVGFMNIDGFKGINDRFGHAVGDQVLIHVAHRLSGLERQSDMVARYGGNEFTLLVERVGGRESAEALLSCFVTTVSSYRSGSKDTRSTCR